MSKINAKNLTYEQKLPPFLAALRGQAADPSGGPDPILAARRRAVKPRSKSEEAEDAPLVLDEHGDVLSGVTVGHDGGATMAEGADVPADEASNDTTRETVADAVASFGAGKKRKVGKVVGGGESSDEGEARKRHGNDARKRKHDDKAQSRDDDTRHDSRKSDSRKHDKHSHSKPHKHSAIGPVDPKAGPLKEKKKKAKKIKLSFEDDEEEG